VGGGGDGTNGSKGPEGRARNGGPSVRPRPCPPAETCWIAGSIRRRRQAGGGERTFAGAAAESVPVHVAGHCEREGEAARRYTGYLPGAAGVGRVLAPPLNRFPAALDGAAQEVGVAVEQALQHAVQNNVELLAVEELAEVRFDEALAA
jgi:hypothetical protein